jgi:hypothetical protein
MPNEKLEKAVLAWMRVWPVSWDWGIKSLPDLAEKGQLLPMTSLM